MNQRAPGAASASAENTNRAQTARAEAATDRLLVRRFVDGDGSAFTAIVGRYRERIESLAERFLRNRADAQEIAQDTFVRAFRGLAQFRGESSLSTWLHRVAVNLARNRYWYFVRRRKHLTLSLDCPLGPDSNDSFAELVGSEEPGPVRQAASQEFVGLVATCMEQLDLGHREILVLRNQLHRSYDQIALTLNLQKGTVKSRIARARDKLRDLMISRCPEFSSESGLRDWFEPIHSRGSITVRTAA